MKARVKATGYACEFQRLDSTTFLRKTDGKIFQGSELEFIEDDPDYWTRLEHQYAGMAMQGMLNNSLLITSLLKVNKSHEDIVDEVTGTAIEYAHALVEQLKEKEEK